MGLELCLVTLPAFPAFPWWVCRRDPQQNLSLCSGDGCCAYAGFEVWVFVTV